MKPSAGQLRVASSSASHVRGHKCPLGKPARTETNGDDTQRESITSPHMVVHRCTNGIVTEAVTSGLWPGAITVPIPR